ncbi:hypothetical protein [Pedobacter gandavensis]|uniref:Uncharacterized protein n=1 Tax=Pedobacter gandavensis TaxID=2679963 RepID=A0ABR6F0N2_9SPHI|nr:hypothetical protein [Pedobacter gandavensis]MBB2151095.1 hypothetical protein [Pedobacter gandavensis]
MAFLPLNEEQLEASMEVYLFLSAANHDAVSDTIYLGNVNGTFENPKLSAEGKKAKKAVMGDLSEKARYEKLSIQYKVQMELKSEERIKPKAFKSLEREFLVLENRRRGRETKGG